MPLHSYVYVLGQESCGSFQVPPTTFAMEACMRSHARRHGSYLNARGSFLRTAMCGARRVRMRTLIRLAGAAPHALHWLSRAQATCRTLCCRASSCRGVRTAICWRHRRRHAVVRSLSRRRCGSRWRAMCSHQHEVQRSASFPSCWMQLNVYNDARGGQGTGPRVAQSWLEWATLRWRDGPTVPFAPTVISPDVRGGTYICNRSINPHV